MLSAPQDVAKTSPYFKYNHIGKVMCTLCHVYCNDELNFLKHLAGKTHSLSLQRSEMQAARHQHLHREEERSRAAEEKARSEAAARQLLLNSSVTGGSSSTPFNGGSRMTSAAASLTGLHGVPTYTYRTECDPSKGSTKVWITFCFPMVDEGTRPSHRWISSREQSVEPADDYFIYLLVGCEGYTTAAVKLPAAARPPSSSMMLYSSSSSNDGQQQQGAHYTWDAVTHQYQVFFEAHR